MTGRIHLACLFAVVLLLPAHLHGQYALEDFLPNVSGGTSTGIVFIISGTFDDSNIAILSGGNFALDRGFWSFSSLEFIPTLSVTVTNGALLVSWQNFPNGWQLEYAVDLAVPPESWSPIPPPYAQNGTDCFITEPVSSPAKFFRLRFQP